MPQNSKRKLPVKRSFWVPLSSFAIIAVISILSAIFLWSEKRLVSSKTDEICKSIAIGISSASLD